MIDTNTNICVRCNEKISNPICPFCLSRDINQWLKGQESGVKKEIEKEIKNKLKNNTHSKECVICGYGSVYMCPPCFLELIYNRLKNIASPETRLEFLRLFNFDSEHGDYTKEKIELEEAIE